MSTGSPCANYWVALACGNTLTGISVIAFWNVSLYHPAMDIKQLRYFTTVSRMGSLSRAAGALKVTQPALSKQISNLEESLGSRLLIRNGRGVTPTEAGQRLVRHAQRILELVVEAEADVRATGAGRFAIGLPFTIAATIATDLIASLRLAEPSVNLAVIQGRSHLLTESLSTGAIDAAIVFKPDVTSPLVETTTLVTEDLFLMASAQAARSLARKAPIAVENLCDFPIIAPSRPNAIRLILEEAFRREKKTPKFSMEVDNLDIIVDLVAKGEGFAVLSNLSRSLSAHKADIVPIPLSPPLKLEICMAVSTRGSLSQANRNLLKLAEEIGRKLLLQAMERRQH